MIYMVCMVYRYIVAGHAFMFMEQSTYHIVHVMSNDEPYAVYTYDDTINNRF